MDFYAARKHMVDSQVRPNDVTNLALQHALETIPRENFLPGHLKNQAYIECEHVYNGDKGTPENEGSTRILLKARDFAKLVAGAAPRKTDLVLDVACGSGYATAILAQLTEMVVGVESDEHLRTLAQENLLSLDIDNAAIVEGEPAEGVSSQGPYDLIFIGGTISQEPTTLLNQLKPGGKLATFWKQGAGATGILYTRNNESFSRIELFDAGTKAVLTEFTAKPAFTF